MIKRFLLHVCPLKKLRDNLHIIVNSETKPQKKIKAFTEFLYFYFLT